MSHNQYATDPTVERARWRLTLPIFECRNAFPQETFSTRGDLILTCIRNKNEGYEQFLLSIRTTGCKARLIILTEVGHVFPDKYKILIDYTDAEVVEMSTPYQLSNDFTRNTWFLEFLEARRNEFRRIFVCDAFDVWFQRDVFQIFNATDRITFIGEDQAIGQQPINKEWVMGCYGAAGAEKLADKLILCHGTIYGSPELLYQYFKVLMSEKWSDGCPLDQPKLQHLAYDGILAQHGIKWEYSGCDGPVLTMRQCGNRGKKINGVMMITNRFEIAPHIVHQWNKRMFRRLKLVMMRKCGPTIKHMELNWKPNWLWHDMRIEI